MRSAVLVFTPVRDASVYATARHPLDRRRRPGPVVGARGRRLVQPFGNTRERPPVSAELKRAEHERRARGISDEPLVVVLPIAVGHVRCDVDAAPNRVGQVRLVSQPSRVRSRKYSAIIRLIWRKIRPSAVVKSNSGSVALANSARWSLSSLSVVRPPTSVRAKRSSL